VYEAGVRAIRGSLADLSDPWRPCVSPCFSQRATFDTIEDFFQEFSEPPRSQRLPGKPPPLTSTAPAVLPPFLKSVITGPPKLCTRLAGRITPARRGVTTSVARGSQAWFSHWRTCELPRARACARQNVLWSRAAAGNWSDCRRTDDTECSLSRSEPDLVARHDNWQRPVGRKTSIL